MDAKVVRVALPGSIMVSIKTPRDAAAEAGIAVTVVVDPERACLFASGKRGENLCVEKR